MSSVMSRDSEVKSERSLPVSQRANALAERLEQGAQALAAVASALTDAEWQTRIPKDGRKIGVVVHHVATMYPLEIQLSQALAGGNPVTGVTWDVVAQINAETPKSTASRKRRRWICFSATARPPRPQSRR